jgi:predicted component of viral defense system (DUF524 family)
MEVYRLSYSYFTLLAETVRPEVPFQKATARQENIFASTTYKIPSGGTLQLWMPEVGELQLVETSLKLHPVFFENRSYHFTIEFREGVSSAKILTRNKDWEESFVFRRYGGTPVLTGSVNFGNDIGKHSFKIQFQFNADIIESALEFEVFPIKLDYSKDYRRIVSDIEEAYPNLVLDFLKKTYQQFQPVYGPLNNDLIWWSIFQGIFENLIADFQFVVKNPHRRLQEEQEWVRPEKIRNPSPVLEEAFHRYSHVLNKRYLVNRKVLKVDTYENRFVKAALFDVVDKFSRVKEYILRLYGGKLTDSYQKNLKDIQQQFLHLRSHRFFHDIGTFDGFKQESLVLQRRTGYAGILRSWILLKKGYSFLEGASKLELKDIAELYQIWCFLEMKHILQRILGKPPEQVQLAELRVSQFRVYLREGKRSRISFTDSSGQEIELFHELQYLNEFDSTNKTGSYTSVQKPDIVLRIHKRDLVEGQIFTYLFDAKYRLASDEDESLPDAPPEDAINQMHRYRDAIYFSDSGAGYKAKEVIGGYILYPGRDDAEVVTNRSRYYKSIEKVNIGAIPLLPGYQTAHQLLQQHITSLLETGTEKLLEGFPPQRGKNYQPVDSGVLIGMISGDRLTAYSRYLEEMESPEVVFYKKPSLVFEGMVSYFAPYIKGVGINRYYRVTKYRVATRDQVYLDYEPLRRDDSTPVYVLSLSLISSWETPYSIADGNIRIFRYARLSELSNPNDRRIKTILKEDLRDDL